MVPRRYLDSLRGNLCGALLEPNHPGYQQSLVIDNGRINLQPSVVVMAANAQDVATALVFAIEHDLYFTVKGGGHSGAGYCLNQGGMVIDLSGMKARRLDTDQQVLWLDVLAEARVSA